MPAGLAPSHANKLLAGLPPEEFRRLEPLLRVVPSRFKDVLQRSGDPIREVIFPAAGICSVTVTMLDGRTSEVASVGNEGLVGLAAYFGGDLPATETSVQIADGSALVMDAGAFRNEMDRGGALQFRVRRYAHALVGLIAQTAACNALHTAEQRCIRWLLMTRDRLHDDQFPLTQDFLAVMLGVRRASVTLILNELRRRRLIAYEPRLITIRNRPGLEAATCECYALIRSNFGRIWP
jgi:CRP-like cAMP-binding protein